DHRSACGGVKGEGPAGLPRFFELLDLLVRDVPVAEPAARRIEEAGRILGRRAALHPLCVAIGEQVLFLSRNEIGAVQLEERLSFFNPRAVVFDEQFFDPSAYLQGYRYAGRLVGFEDARGAYGSGERLDGYGRRADADVLDGNRVDLDHAFLLAVDPYRGQLHATYRAETGLVLDDLRVHAVLVDDPVAVFVECGEPTRSRCCLCCMVVFTIIRGNGLFRASGAKDEVTAGCDQQSQQDDGSD